MASDQFGDWYLSYCQTHNHTPGMQEVWDAAIQARASTQGADGDAKDAERYRWLRANTRGQSDRRGRQEFEMPDPHPVANIMQGSVAQHLDKAIDAAMAQAPKGDAG